ncbi:hypothetical protein COO91_04897 [Nostoc flagelliforme CCNUN1]|uniref:Uncharacterized protein n=1 Tax=Nostoc flagelliforme CCNUN1 TaxID=2038116 RepID=A0A2K8SU42_9NOSO|nr:hypothetical protein COO91_04897 [Nostoc flagelliforme CCNUN1]
MSNSGLGIINYYDRFIIAMSTTGYAYAAMKQIHKYLSQFS